MCKIRFPNRTEIFVSIGAVDASLQHLKQFTLEHSAVFNNIQVENAPHYWIYIVEMWIRVLLRLCMLQSELKRFELFIPP